MARLKHLPMVADPFGLTNEQIAYWVPSVAAETPADDVSDQYLYISTMRGIDVLREDGWVPTWASQAATRQEGKKDKTKHLVRMRQERFLGDKHPDVHELLLRNSYDRTCAFEMMSGIFRMVCSNGMVVMSQSTGSMKVRHINTILEEVLSAARQVAMQGVGVMRLVEAMKQVELTYEQQMMLAQYMMQIRFGSPEAEEEVNQAERSVRIVDADPRGLMLVRRSEDRSPLMWTKLNQFQENLMKGGIELELPNGKSRKIRPVHGVDATVAMNAKFMEFAQAFYTVITGHAIVVDAVKA